MRALITGGSGGIGKSICDIFKDNGVEVVNPTRKELDLSNPNSLNKYLDSINDLHIIVNNAGVNNLTYIDNTTLKDLNNTFNVNFFSPYLITSHFLDKFRNQGYGRIVNVSSVLGSYSKTSRSTYSSSKAALHSLTKSIVSETKGFNILTNTISPGYIATDLTTKNNTPQVLTKIINSIPTNKLGEPSEIAKWVYNLTIGNNYINGQEIIIDGGLTCTI
jgi:NAD(P)-dependent dehydrogenase (short-subunit alcohol dehydrogenase family)|tara:strand:+ start:874 stop:1530 length:657 start_codon:yes stop_codon:yes gene_type:complete